MKSHEAAVCTPVLAPVIAVSGFILDCTVSKLSVCSVVLDSLWPHKAASHSPHHFITHPVHQHMAKGSRCRAVHLLCAQPIAPTRTWQLLLQHLNGVRVTRCCCCSCQLGQCCAAGGACCWAQLAELQVQTHRLSGIALQQQQQSISQLINP